jgi:hypothetical protein
MICRKCGSDKGSEGPIGRGLCDECFKALVYDLCVRIEQAGPEEIDGVFIGGMSALGAAADAQATIRDTAADLSDGGCAETVFGVVLAEGPAHRALRDEDDDDDDIIILTDEEMED